MPFGSEGTEDAIGLALSGGGFRATLFHLGTLWRLNEFGLLPHVARISSVSGGSITSGVLAKAWPALDWQNGVAANFADLIAAPLRAFCRRSVDVPAVLLGLLTPGKRPSQFVEAAYRDHLFGGMTLQALPDEPLFVFNATNLQTGRSFRMSRPYMGDYRVGLVRRPDLPLARAVAASSAFPPVLSPVTIERPGRFEPVDGADLNGNPAFTARLLLTDGGAYDNLGLQTVWNRCRTLLVSDAGAPFGVPLRVHTNWLAQSSRALAIATDQSRGARKVRLIEEYRGGERYGAYWGIDTDIKDYKIADALPCLVERVKPLAAMRTRLNPFSDAEQGALINWGYALSDAAIRRFADKLRPVSAKPPTWPCPDQALDRR